MKMILHWLSPSRKEQRITVNDYREIQEDTEKQCELRAWQASIEARIRRLETVIEVWSPKS